MPYLKVLRTSVHCAAHLWGQPQSSFVILATLGDWNSCVNHLNVELGKPDAVVNLILQPRKGLCCFKALLPPARVTVFGSWHKNQIDIELIAKGYMRIPYARTFPPHRVHTQLEQEYSVLTRSLQMFILSMYLSNVFKTIISSFKSHRRSKVTGLIRKCCRSWILLISAYVVALFRLQANQTCFSARIFKTDCLFWYFIWSDHFMHPD